MQDAAAADEATVRLMLLHPKTACSFRRIVRVLMGEVGKSM